jgi:hypothetical protein
LAQWGGAWCVCAPPFFPKSIIIPTTYTRRRQEHTLLIVETRAPALTDAVGSVFEQYVSLFATTRALAVFQVRAFADTTMIMIFYARGET